jgi:predicted phage terminase large subunit-like protein
MGTNELLNRCSHLIAKAEGKPGYQLLSDYFELIRKIDDRGRALDKNKTVQRLSAKMAAQGGSKAVKYYELWKRSLLFAARDDFDSYLLYLEWNRDSRKKFYQPRRKVLKTVVNDLQDLEDDKLDFLAVSMPPRVGKLVSDDTSVLTKDGWKNHGDLKVGDMVVSPLGAFVRVTHVFEKNFANVRVKFTDGTYADVHENHEWVVYNRHHGRYETLETKQMMSDYEVGEKNKHGHRYFYQLPIKNFMYGEEKELAVEPYTLGKCLGDETTDKKAIPQEYLCASVDQRLNLLAGLLDSNGCLLRKERRYRFFAREPQLKEDFISLVSTFGWRCDVAEYKPPYVSLECNSVPYFTVTFTPTCFIPCKYDINQLYRFSNPRKVSVCGFEKIEPKRGNCISVEGGVYCIGRRLTVTHNSTLGIFYVTWLMGRHPDLANVMSGHSDKLTKGFYKEVLSILKNPDDYLWNDVFPDCKIAKVSAEDESIDINRDKRFPTLTCRSISGTLTGAVEVGRLLYVDDIIEDLEEALNLDRLENKYNAYLNQLKDRKKDNAKELHIGTRWAVTDVIGRIREQYEGNPRYRFRVIPAVDEKDESNFDYPYGLGFSTKYYHDMRESIDPATWHAKYLGEPYMREGLLFPRDELNWYNGVLPGGEPDMIVSVCDVAWGGGDDLVMPFAYVYGDSVYIDDIICTNGDKSVTQPIVVGKMKQHKPHKTRFEANNGGDEYSDSVSGELRKQGLYMNVTHRRAPNTTSKMARIIQYAPEIKRFYFRDTAHSSVEYRQAMKKLCSFVQNGKNKHDDVPDAFAQLVDFIYNGGTEVKIFNRVF